jgi:GH24 family phage-related lysozyme (muramidase)
LGLDFIRAWESSDINKRHLTPYDDNHGYCTIGVGHLIDGKKSCAALKSSGSPAYKRFEAGISPQQDAMFIRDVQQVVNVALKSIQAPVHQYEFDALIALAYNTPGLYKFKKLLANLNSGNYSACCDEFADITNRGDKGLVKRRKSEMKLFRNNIYDARH